MRHVEWPVSADQRCPLASSSLQYQRPGQSPPRSTVGGNRGWQTKGNITPQGYAGLSSPKWKSKDSISCIPDPALLASPSLQCPHSLPLAPAAGHEQAASLGPVEPRGCANLPPCPLHAAWLPQPVPQQPPAPGAGSEAVTRHSHHQVRPRPHLGTPVLCTTRHQALGEFGALDFAPCHGVSIPGSRKSACRSAVATSSNDKHVSYVARGSAAQLAASAGLPWPWLTRAGLSHLFGGDLPADWPGQHDLALPHMCLLLQSAGLGWFTWQRPGSRRE